MRKATRLLPLALCMVMLSAAARRRAVIPPVTLNLDARRSFAVTDVAILNGFPFERVMTALTAGTATSPLQLYQQWLDTQNAKPGLVAPDGPHCDDFAVDGGPSLNGFPRRCPTPEGLFAKDLPFTPAQYTPIGITNRFDLAAADGSNCGQYRLVYARASVTPNLFHIIFEGVLPNPNPAAGLSGCAAVAQFWADLTRVDSMDERRARLEMFFFQGLPGFSPLVRAENYNTPGGIRTSESNGSVGNRMYQFRAVRTCAGSDCRIVMTPDVLENMVFGTFFDAHLDTPQARQFRDDFVQQVQTLAVRDVNEYFMKVPSQYLMGESNPSDKGVPLAFYDVPFTQGMSTQAGKDFSDRIATELTRIGSTLTPDQIVSRAETQTCVGCHLVTGPVGEGVVFPRPGNNFQQLDENATEPGEAGQRFAISPAMQVFIPHRMQILRDFLTNGRAPVHSDLVATIGGGRSVQ